MFGELILRASQVLLPVIFVLVAGPSWVSAQENACDIPLVVSRFVSSTGKVELVGDLSRKDIAVSVGGVPVTTNKISEDTGSKRVALILDASRSIPKEEWKLATGMAVSLIENARPLDRFVLFVVGVNSQDGGFYSSWDMQAKLKELASSRPRTVGNDETIYDALLAAGMSLNPPEFGDSVFLFGHPDDHGSKATYEQVETLFLRDLLRFYAMSFSDPLAGKIPPGFDLNKPLPKNALPGGADTISHATGYFFSYHPAKALRIPGQLALLEGFLGDLYTGISRPYRINIAVKATGRSALHLSVVKGEDRGIHNDDVHYPRFIYPCASR